MSKFWIVKANAVRDPDLIGPFDHKEDAEAYAKKKFSQASFGNVVSMWRVVQAKEPERG